MVTNVKFAHLFVELPHLVIQTASCPCDNVYLLNSFDFHPKAFYFQNLAIAIYDSLSTALDGAQASLAKAGLSKAKGFKVVIWLLKIYVRVVWLI
ncbi:hypothetical protein [Carboxylicivirga sp. M1479]|uniref:hypothetical protein n=1 Tax=Carboxylicivirga sp. M1479 TaxID=2594476 RepID=UPI00163D712B|nr:hypothetical protein [Carboxylicivirga sp. M1479]